MLCVPCSFVHSIKLATTGGIGFFLAHLGLQTAEGIGLVVTDIATGVTLGGCPAGNRTYAEYDGLTADVSIFAMFESCLHFRY